VTAHNQWLELRNLFLHTNSNKTLLRRSEFHGGVSSGSGLGFDTVKAVVNVSGKYSTFSNRSTFLSANIETGLDEIMNLCQMLSVKELDWLRTLFGYY
jgi:hypothetical protein